MECKTCSGEGGITADNFGDVQSFECPDCKGTGKADLISEVRAALKAANYAPWERDESPYILDANGKVICRLWYIDGEYPNQANNAHLISNAPTWLQQLSDRLEEAVKALEEMVDEMGYLKSQFNTGDIAGLGIFSDADALVDRAGDIIIDILGYK